MEHLLDILTSFYKCKKVYEKRCQSIMKRYDLKLADLEILYYVSHAGSKNMARDIVDMGWSKASVSKSVEHIHAKGYVALHEDKEDRRCIHIEVTEAAAPIVAEVKRIREQVGESMAAGISKKDIDVVVDVIKQLQSNMSRELAEQEST